MNKIIEKYEKRIKHYNFLMKQQMKKLDTISNLRLLTFLLGLAISIGLYIFKKYYLLGIVLITAFIVFLYLVRQYDKITINKEYSESLIKINQKAINRIKGDWKSFDDKGEDFLSEDHNYSYDLDIFGKGSLFQWMNEANTYIGRRKLKDVLTQKVKDINDIYERQEAIHELSSNLSWRERLIAEGTKIKGKTADLQEVFNWAKEKDEFILRKDIIITLRALPVITLTAMVISFGFSLIPVYFPIALILIQYILLRINKNKRINILDMAEKHNEEIKIYKNIIRIIEKHKFNANYLANLQKKLCDKQKSSVSNNIDKLARITDLIANRHNMLYAIINILFMLDYDLLIELETWKLKSGAYIEGWINVIGDMECLSSLAIIRHDNPDWTIPTIQVNAAEFKADGMGHPLIGEERVCNDLIISESQNVLLITGSNMSGKSTLLRTVGINLVLAYAGAPVCSRNFYCGVKDIYTCMRINDNLDKNTSSFYAELLKIKKIVDAAKNGDKIFFLLDEIFKGTNSKDRHTGAMILIKQLSGIGNIGMVSTHDIELGELEKEENSRIKNYHFSEYYKDNKICFDYKLKYGVCNTKNAEYLMKLIGIEI